MHLFLPPSLPPRFLAFLEGELILPPSALSFMFPGNSCLWTLSCSSSLVFFVILVWSDLLSIIPVVYLSFLLFPQRFLLCSLQDWQISNKECYFLCLLFFLQKMPNSHEELPQAAAAEMFGMVAPVLSDAKGKRCNSGSAGGDAAQDGCFDWRSVNIQTRHQWQPRYKAANDSPWGSLPPGEGEMCSQ